MDHARGFHVVCWFSTCEACDGSDRCARRLRRRLEDRHGRLRGSSRLASVPEFDRRAALVVAGDRCRRRRVQQPCAPTHRLTLRQVCSGSPVEQIITLTATRPRFGGVRWWFCCPSSGARVRALFLPPGARRWASRTAHRLHYTSQRAGSTQREFSRMLAGAEGAGARRNAVRRVARRQRVSARAASTRGAA